MSKTTNGVSKSAKSALKEIESRLRDQGYDEREVEEVCFAARAKFEDRLSTPNEKIDFSDIIADFASPELAPEVSDRGHGTSSLGAIALLFSLIIIALFATVPFIVGEEGGGAAMLTLAIIASPVGAFLGWKSRRQLFGKIALVVSTLPMIGLSLSVMLQLMG